MRRTLSIVVAGLLAAIAALVAATPAQAHPIYRRAFGSIAEGGCMWGMDWNFTPYRDACGKTPNTAAKWNLHVVADDYGPDSHEVWVLENIAYPRTCLNVVDLGYPALVSTMGSCAYAGERPSLFEAFYMGKTSSGASYYQMKSIYDWDLYPSSGDRCLASDNIDDNIKLEPCNQVYTNWTVTAAA